ncbi:predicted protein [Chaetoceros tenuissimus]|uniref:Uncharacterized protein n=1 Tax=Chaetoceros tenuissimus TaxID=426638 RepID=A0AAD3HG89_9STRA|nr:predicted protein [Chaetoceros tenuissimus]
MIYDNESIAYYLEHVRTIDDFIQANGERVIIFYIGHNHVFNHAGQVLYRENIANNAQAYQAIPVINRREKTSLTKTIVKNLIADGFIFVQCDSERGNQYFAYDTTNQQGFSKVRVKIAQAIGDYICKNLPPLDADQGVGDAQRPIPEENVVAAGNTIGNIAVNPPEINNVEEIPLLNIATGAGVVYYDPLLLMNHAAGADDVPHNPLPPPGIQPALDVTNEHVAIGLPLAEAQFHVPEIQMNAVPAQDSVDVELQMLAMEDIPNGSVDEMTQLMLADQSTSVGSDIPTSNDESEEYDNWSMQMSLFDDDMYEDMDEDLSPGHEFQNVFEN